MVYTDQLGYVCIPVQAAGGVIHLGQRASNETRCGVWLQEWGQYYYVEGQVTCPECRKLLQSKEQAMFRLPKNVHFVDARSGEFIFSTDDRVIMANFVQQAGLVITGLTQFYGVIRENDEAKEIGNVHFDQIAGVWYITILGDCLFKTEGHNG